MEPINPSQSMAEYRQVRSSRIRAVMATPLSPPSPTDDHASLSSGPGHAARHPWIFFDIHLTGSTEHYAAATRSRRERRYRHRGEIQPLLSHPMVSASSAMGSVSPRARQHRGNTRLGPIQSQRHLAAARAACPTVTSSGRRDLSAILLSRGTGSAGHPGAYH